MSFDILAPHYHWMECVLAGGKLHRCRTSFLDQVPCARSILLLGEGHGRALVECHRRFPHARIVCVDASQRMLAEARRSLARNNQDDGRVRFLQADLLHWIPTGEPCDLIITNFLLDCFRPEQLDRIITQFSEAAGPEASWLIADFKTPSAGLKRIRGRLILWTMYTFFRKITGLPASELTAPDQFLERAGFTLTSRIESEWGLLHSDWWQKSRLA